MLAVLLNQIANQNGVASLASSLGANLPKCLVLNHSPRINRAVFVAGEHFILLKFFQ